MPTVAEIQRERKALLREIRRRERALDTSLERLERLLFRMLDRKTLITLADMQKVGSYFNGLGDPLNELAKAVADSIFAITAEF